MSGFPLTSNFNSATPITPGNSTPGSGVKRCPTCVKVERDTKEVVKNGLRLIRVRYGLPYVECPDLGPSQLGRYLQFLLLQGQERASVVFPRQQTKKRDAEGFVILQRLRRHDRWEFAQSVSSIKRSLPTSCSLHSPSARSSWEATAFSIPPPTDPEYLRFVTRTVTRLFPACWDRGYRSACLRHFPQASARLGGNRADEYYSQHVGEEAFNTSVLEETDLPSTLLAEYAEVPSAGKLRPLLIFGPEIDLLAPLHKCLYERLSKFPWLLRGPPTPERIGSVCIHPFQTSVDLVSATDNLAHDVARTILDALFFQSAAVPRSIRQLAYASLAPVVLDESGRVLGKVTHGQMMGAYLSFPLLCLQSYLAALWAAGGDDADALMLVNGDDCVISSQRPVRQYPVGFRLNESKTIRAENVVEINSTTFLRRGKRWREVRHLRRGGFCTDWSGMRHISQAVGISVRWTDAFVRCRFGTKWKFLPSQLGLRPDSYAAFSRQRSMLARRTHTALPECPALRDELLCPVYNQADWDARAAASLRSHLFIHARKVGRRKGERWSPTIGAVFRTYGYRKEPPWSYPSFRGQVAGGRGPRKYKREIYGYVPVDYQSREELEGVAKLKALTALFESGEKDSSGRLLNFLSFPSNWGTGGSV
jgi:hypothetical protein